MDSETEWTPKVTVVTPSYNQAQFLEETLLSVLNQTYPNIEYIVIDGGSTDGSVDIIKNYEDQIDYWLSEKDSGQSNAINKGFKRATGDIVAWLNSDDLYFPDTVERAVAQFQKNKQLSLYYGDCVFINEAGGFLRYFTEVENYSLKRLCDYTDYIMQPTTFFSRERLLEVGMLDEDLHYGMDWDLWCKLAKKGEVYYDKNVVAANREYGETKTNTGGRERLSEIKKINDRHRLGWVSWAFLSYCFAEVYHRQRFAAEKGSLTAQIFLALLSLVRPRKMLQLLGLRKKCSLYGLKSHSKKVLENRVYVSLPLWKKADSLKVVLSGLDGYCKLNWSGRSERVDLVGKTHTIELPVLDISRGRNDIEFIFSEDVRKPKIYSVEWA